MGNTLHTQPKIPPLQQQQQELQHHHQQQQRQFDDENQEFTCEICIEPTSNSDKKFRNNDKCSHPFCTDCVMKYIHVKLKDNNLGKIKCPAFNCDHTLDPIEWAPLVGPSLFVRWCDVLCESSIMGLEKCYCPNQNCNALIVNKCGEKVKNSECPNCKKWFCFECKRVWHAGFGCEERWEERDRNDVAFGRLVEKMKWNRCPRCRHFIELMEGCPIVKCRCGISFCYRCEVQVDRHWCRCSTMTIRMRRTCCIKLCILVFFGTIILHFLAAEIKRQIRKLE